MSDGYIKARETADKLGDRDTVSITVGDQPKTETAIQKLDEQYFKDYANLGMETVTPDDLSTPTLNLIQSNSKVRDESGRPYTPGDFYHTKTKKIYKTVDVAFLQFSKGDYPSYSDKSVLVHTYVYYGVTLPDMEPFKIYLRNAGIGEAKKFNTDVVSMKRPLFALNVTLSSREINGDKGDYFVPQFKINGVHVNPNAVMTLQELAQAFVKSGKANEEVNPSDIPF